MSACQEIYFNDNSNVIQVNIGASNSKRHVN